MHRRDWRENGCSPLAFPPSKHLETTKLQVSKEKEGSVEELTRLGRSMKDALSVDPVTSDDKKKSEQKPARGDGAPKDDAKIPKEDELVRIAFVGMERGQRVVDPFLFACGTAGFPPPSLFVARKNVSFPLDPFSLCMTYSRPPPLGT